MYYRVDSCQELQTSGQLVPTNKVNVSWLMYYLVTCKDKQLHLLARLQCKSFISHAQMVVLILLFCQHENSCLFCVVWFPLPDILYRLKTYKHPSTPCNTVSDIVCKEKSCLHIVLRKFSSVSKKNYGVKSAN